MSNTALHVALFAALWCTTARAQVGHDPERSPYRDVPVSHALVLSGGYLSGSGARVGAGPSNGPLLGVRYTMRLGGAFEAVFGAAGAWLRRIVYNQNAAPDTTTQSVLIGDVGFQFLLTGQKSWRGLVPFFGATMGLAYGDAVPQDTSGFRFRSRFQFGPQVGIRWYASRALSLRIEGRDIMWRLRYPTSYFQYPLGAPLLVNGVAPPSEWTHNPTLTLALGIATRF